MNREELIALACRTADSLTDNKGRLEFVFDDHGLESFAAAIATAERDACVEVCDNLIGHYYVSEVQLRYNEAYEHCKDKIRARGET